MGMGLSADQAVILAFGRTNQLDLKVGSETPRRNANVLYYVPVGIGIHGAVTFGGDLLRPSVVASDAQFFERQRFFLSMGAGSATLSYRPIPFEGTFGVREIRMVLGTGGGSGPIAGGKAIEPLPAMPVDCTDRENSFPEGCMVRRDDLLPEIDVFDRTGEGTWVRLPRMAAEATYTLANPTRYVDPVTGQILVRFVNSSPEMSSGFMFQAALMGDVQ